MNKYKFNNYEPGPEAGEVDRCFGFGNPGYSLFFRKIIGDKNEKKGKKQGSDTCNYKVYNIHGYEFGELCI